MKLIIMSTLMAIFIPPLLALISLITSMHTYTNNREKTSPFECGFDPLRSARVPFSMRFFLLAIIFIVFDIEIILLIPLPLLITRVPSDFMIITTCLFLLILIMGLIYEWADGSLNWNS